MPVSTKKSRLALWIVQCMVVGILAATVVRGQWPQARQRETSRRLATGARRAEIGLTSAAA